MGQTIQEPSMEDILSSIKRIIDEDAAPPSPPPQRTRSRPVAVPEAGPVAASAEPQPMPSETSDAQSEAVGDGAPEPDVLELTTPIAPPAGWQPAILSATAEQASRTAFQSLSRLQLRATEAEQPATLEGLVGELLRPMLRDWLDRELPAIVERIVTAEVRRLSGQG